MTWKEIDRRAAGAGVPQYRIASKLGISEATFGRRRREELSPELAEQILAAIEELEEGCTDE